MNRTKIQISITSETLKYIKCNFNLRNISSKKLSLGFTLNQNNYAINERPSINVYAVYQLRCLGRFN